LTTLFWRSYKQKEPFSIKSPVTRIQIVIKFGKIQLFTAVSYHTNFHVCKFNSFLDSLISEVTTTDIL